MCVLGVPTAAENLIVTSLRSVHVHVALLHVTVLRIELSGGEPLATFDVRPSSNGQSVTSNIYIMCYDWFMKLDTLPDRSAGVLTVGRSVCGCRGRFCVCLNEGR